MTFGYKTEWPSGLRRWIKAPVRKGAGSNPVSVIFFFTTQLCFVHIKFRFFFVRKRECESKAILLEITFFGGGDSSSLFLRKEEFCFFERDTNRRGDDGRKRDAEISRSRPNFREKKGEKGESLKAYFYHRSMTHNNFPLLLQTRRSFRTRRREEEEERPRPILYDRRRSRLWCCASDPERKARDLKKERREIEKASKTFSFPSEVPSIEF